MFAFFFSSRGVAVFPPRFFQVIMVIVLIFCSNQKLFAQAWQKDLLNYIHTRLEKSDSGYGWEDQPDAHLTPTFAVIGILQDIGRLPVARDPLISFVRTHHPQRGINRETGPSGFDDRVLLYQQIQSLVWLGDEAASAKQEVSGWKSDARNLYNYEEHHYGVLEEEMMMPVCRHLLHIPLDDITPAFTAYLQERRRANGSFNNAPADDGGDGNILNTYWGVYGLQLLNHSDEEMDKKTIAWIRSCQLKNGGFTHQPHPVIGANDEVAYTWAAVKTLARLSAKPADEKACIRYLLSLKNADGGFGNRPGLPSTPMSTYYAIDALKTLGALTDLDKMNVAHAGPQKADDFSGLNVYSVQFEAQGTGSPEEAVMLADSLGIQLWGAKNDNPGWIAAAQQIAAEKKVPLTFFRADEPYGKNVHVPGMGTFSHILDYFAPAGLELPAIGEDPSWEEYNKAFVQPLLVGGGALFLQISNNEPLARMLLDEAVKSGAYAAISTIHFDQNFLFFLPFLYQYRYQLPFIALQDAHGTESWWWSNDLIHYRTLFLAKEPTYQGMREALQHNWVVAVRHDSLSGYRTRILGGTHGVQQYILSKQDQWKWWTDDPTVLKHPWAIITVVQPTDSFEAARPEQGVNIRIRCWWETNKQVLKYPLVELVQLRIDNALVKPEYIEKKDMRGRLMADSYYLYSIAKPSEGMHTIEATLKYYKDNSVRTMTRTFRYERPAAP